MLNFSPSSHQLCLCFFACPTQNRWLRSFDPSHSLFSSLFLEFSNMPTSKQTCGSFSSQQPFKVITHHPLGFLPTFLHSSSLGISLAVPLVPLKRCFPPNESILYRACSWPWLPVLLCCYGLYSTCFIALQMWVIFSASLKYIWICYRNLSFCVFKRNLISAESSFFCGLQWRCFSARSLSKTFRFSV